MGRRLKTKTQARILSDSSYLTKPNDDVDATQGCFIRQSMSTVLLAHSQKNLRNCTYKISNYFFYKNYLYIETRQNIFKQHYCRRHKVSCFPFSYKYHEMSKFTYIFGNDYFVTVICSIQQNIYSPKTVRGLWVRVGAPSVDNIILLF